MNTERVSIPSSTCSVMGCTCGLPRDPAVASLEAKRQAAKPRVHQAPFNCCFCKGGCCCTCGASKEKS